MLNLPKRAQQCPARQAVECAPRRNCDAQKTLPVLPTTRGECKQKESTRLSAWLYSHRPAPQQNTADSMSAIQSDSLSPGAADACILHVHISSHWGLLSTRSPAKDTKIQVCIQGWEAGLAQLSTSASTRVKLTVSRGPHLLKGALASVGGLEGRVVLAQLRHRVGLCALQQRLLCCLEILLLTLQ